MPFIVTPRRLNQQAELYHQFAGLTTAGVGLVQATELLSRNPPSLAFKRILARLHEQLIQGSTFGEALESLGAWMPAFDQALISAGEKTGRLDVCFRLLADYYRERAELIRNLISDMAYPVIMLHLALIIFPTSDLVKLVLQGNVAGFLGAKLVLFVPAYAIVLGVIYACQGRHGEPWRAQIESVLNRIPILGKARRQLALARLASALEASISAGVSIIEGWALAASASGSPALGRVVAGWDPKLRAGLTPAELVKETSYFPDVFSSLYATGETSGQLDTTLKRLHQYYQAESSRQFHLLAKYFPRLVYLIIVLFIAYRIVSFYQGYFANINQILQ